MLSNFKKILSLTRSHRLNKVAGWLIEPKSDNEDTARIEFILNSILLAWASLVAVVFLGVLHNFIVYGSAYQGNSPLFIAALFGLFVGLLVLSRRGFIKVASYGLVVVLFLPILYGMYYTGVDQPQILLSYTVIIVMSGILLGIRPALLVTTVIVLAVLILGTLQVNGFYSIHINWKQQALNTTDVIVFSVTFCVLATISWLSNREIEKSLFRARGAERELREERDSLEIKVKERTEELERAQFEKTKQLQSFVEFGRNASGLFHDMVNPIQSAILSLYTLKKNAATNDSVSLGNSVDDVVRQMEKARELIGAARNQIAKQDIDIIFDPEEQIALVFQMLSFRAKREGVNLLYTPHATPLSLKGNPLSFYRLLAGLISNSIDAYDGVPLDRGHPRVVTVTAETKNGYLYFSVADNGRGISAENQPKIFKSFFTTKSMEKGTGIGLTLCKEIAEKEFGGALSFTSTEGVGSVFAVKLRIKR